MEPPKLFTNGGKPVARYTMLCKWRKEWYGVNKRTGEIIRQWTYRSDKELADLEADGKTVARPLDVMAVIFAEYKERCLSMKMWDNTLPPKNQLLAHVVNNDVKYPNDAYRIAKFWQWINTVKVLDMLPDDRALIVPESVITIQTSVVTDRSESEILELESKMKRSTIAYTPMITAIGPDMQRINPLNP